MKRLLATIRLDMTLQARNRIYVIVLGAAVSLALALGSLISPAQLQFFMPLIVLGGVSVTTVFLVGVLILLERGEGTLSVVLVSPLRQFEYLGSKTVSLTALALTESAIIAVVAYGLDFSFGWLLLSVVMRATMGVAVGVAVGVRYRSITHFLLPAILVSIAFDVPVIWYLDPAHELIFLIWPTMPPLILAKASFTSVPTWQLVYALSYGALTIGVAVWWALNAINRFVVRGEHA